MSIAITDGDKLPLHTLKLIYCSLPWYSLNLSRLESLFLCSVCSCSLQNIVEFCSILGTMQVLTVLYLEDSLPSAHDFLSSGLDISPTISLPYLTLLMVITPLLLVVTLLSCVNILWRTHPTPELLFEPRQLYSNFFISCITIQSTIICLGLSFSCPWY